MAKRGEADYSLKDERQVIATTSGCTVELDAEVGVLLGTFSWDDQSLAVPATLKDSIIFAYCVLIVPRKVHLCR